uniref:Transposase (Putative), gypsy type n=1 Tax=Tanacetum cinerariifolium TaxID=118510 RepID=A0A6L2NLQ3_TANCI|nr:hypothetical protein [Tanacetum cinerariifolium]
MGRDTVQLETAVSTISLEYLLEFTSEYGISKALHPKLPGPEDRIVDFPKGKIQLSQLSVIGAAKQEAWEKYPAVLHQALKLSKKLEQPLLLGGRESVPNYHGLAYQCSKGWNVRREHVFPRGCKSTGHTSYPHPETTRGITLLSGKSQILPGGRDMDLFNLIRAPNPTKVKTGSRPRTAHKVPLLTVIANRVIEIEDRLQPQTQRGCPPEVPPENVITIEDAPKTGPAERVAAPDPPAAKERRKRGHDGVDTNAPPKLGMRSTRPTPALQGAPVDVSDPDPLSFAEPLSRPATDIAQELLRQEIHSLRKPPSHLWSGLLRYNVNLAQQVAMGSQLRLRFEQEAKLLKKSVAQVVRRDKRIQARENEIKNLETLLEAEADMKKAAKDKSAKLSQELENMRAMFSDLQVSNNCLSQQVSTLQEQVSGEEKLKAAFKEFKQYEDNRVEQRCVEMDARLDALSIDFDEELFPHMLTAIASRKWMIGRGLHLAVMKCGESVELRQAFADVVSAGIAKGMSEGLKHGVKHGQAQLDLEAIEAYDSKAEAKYIAALEALKNLKYPLVDQLEGLKDAPMDVIMASLHLESDNGDDAPQWVRELRHSTSQLTIPVYPEVCDPMDPWAYKEEILLADAIAANVSRAEKKKKCCVVCRTHGIGSAHHARSDGVLVSVPTVIPQGLSILLADAATQTKTFDEASQLLRFSSLPVMHS